MTAEPTVHVVIGGNMHKVVAERGGGSTEAGTAAAAVVAAVVAAVPTALPPPSSPSSSHSLH